MRAFRLAAPIILLLFGPCLLGQGTSPTAESLFREGKALGKAGLIDSSSKVLHQAYEMARLNGQSELTLSILQSVALELEMACLEEQLLSEAEKLLALAREDGHAAREAMSRFLLSHYYLEKARYPTALEHCRRGAEIADSLDDKHLWAFSRFFLGSALRVLHNDTRYPLPYFEVALAGFRQVADTAFVVRSALVLASGETDPGKQQAYMQLAADLADAYGSQPLIMRTWVHRAAYLSPKEGIPLLEEALSIARKIPSPYWIQHIYLQLSHRYQQLQQYDIALQQVRLAVAAYPEGLPDGGAQNYYAIYRQMGELPLAFQYLDTFLNAEDTRNSQEIQMLVAEWESQMKMQEAEAELLRKESELKFRRSLQFLLLALLVFMAAAFGLGAWGYQMQRSNRLKLEQQNAIIREQSEELKSADRAKSRFFANVAHELRTPLTLILGPLSSLQKNTRLEKDEREQVEVAMEQGDRLLRHINQLLEMGRLEFGKVEVKPAPTPPAVLLETVFRSFEPEAQSRGIALRLEHGIPADLWLLLDEQKAEQIAFNLVSNALKFTPGGGTVTLQATYQDGYLDLSVVDTGPGIPDAELPNIFERYYQVQEEEVSEGTGIGLSLSKELAELMGGELTVSSTLGQGSTFRLLLPASVAAEQIIPMPGIQEADVLGREGRPRILIVEDNAELRRYLARLLSDRYTVESASDGREALDLLQNGYSHPQLLITDIMMPGMDGFSLIEAVRHDPGMADLSVMVLTARSGEQDLLRALRLGVDDYVVKPFTEAELMVGVETLMTRSQVREEEARVQPAPVSKEWLLQLQDVVGRRLGEFDLKAEDIAHELNMSRTQFFRQIKKDTGLTPAQYLEEARFQRARMLLESGKVDAVKAVAYDVGFKQVKYFSRLFKDRFGKTPSEFLEK